MLAECYACRSIFDVQPMRATVDLICRCIFDQSHQTTKHIKTSWKLIIVSVLCLAAANTMMQNVDTEEVTQRLR